MLTNDRHRLGGCDVERFGAACFRQLADSTKDRKDTEDTKDGFCVRFVCVFSLAPSGEIGRRIVMRNCRNLVSRSFGGQCNSRASAPTFAFAYFFSLSPALPLEVIMHILITPSTLSRNLDLDWLHCGSQGGAWTAPQKVSPSDWRARCA
jgi:hypothetical protein